MLHVLQFIAKENIGNNTRECAFEKRSKNETSGYDSVTYHI